MTAVKGQSSRFGAVKGLITEQNDTNFEPDSMVAGENVIPEINGNLRRRTGIDIIHGEVVNALGNILTITEADLRYGAVSKYKWENPNRVFNCDVVVMQVGSTVYFFKHAENIIENLIGSVSLLGYSTNSGYVREVQCGYAVIAGYLVIVNRYMNPIVVSIGSTGTVAVERVLDLKMRVTDRVTSGALGGLEHGGVEDIITRPGILTDAHHFDLRNAGWPATTTCTADEAGNSTVEQSPIDFTKDSIGVYPAIADVFLSYKTSSVEAPEALDTYSPWELKKSSYSTTVPPRGHYITPVYQFSMLELMMDEDSALGVSGEVGYNGEDIVLTTAVRPYYVGALNGHVIFVTKDYIGREIIAYSKLVMSPADMEICYQEADPTAEEINDVLPTDGGIIPLNHVPEITHMEEWLGGLLMFTVDGIHMISGNSDEGFNATSQRVMKVSDVACLSGQGVVKLDDRFYFWNQDGLIVLGRDQYGDIKVQNLTRGLLDLFVKQFSKDNLSNAIGDVDTMQGRVFYTMPTSKGGELILNRYKSNIVLVLDTQLGGFYYHRIAYDSTCPHLLMPLVIGGNASVPYELGVQTTGGEYIATIDGQAVSNDSSIMVSVSNQLLFMCAVSTDTVKGIGAAKFMPGEFYDWTDFMTDVYSTTGKNYVSFAEFMHKRDANLAASTNLTNIQSFFKVKDVNVINIPGDSNIPEDPMWAEFACPLTETVAPTTEMKYNKASAIRAIGLFGNYERDSEIYPQFYQLGLSTDDRQIFTPVYEITDGFWANKQIVHNTATTSHGGEYLYIPSKYVFHDVFATPDLFWNDAPEVTLTDYRFSCRTNFYSQYYGEGHTNTEAPLYMYAYYDQVGQATERRYEVAVPNCGVRLAQAGSGLDIQFENISYTSFAPVVGDYNLTTSLSTPQLGGNPIDEGFDNASSIVAAMNEYLYRFYTLLRAHVAAGDLGQIKLNVMPDSGFSFTVRDNGNGTYNVSAAGSNGSGSMVLTPAEGYGVNPTFFSVSTAATSLPVEEAAEMFATYVDPLITGARAEYTSLNPPAEGGKYYNVFPGNAGFSVNRVLTTNVTYHESGYYTWDETRIAEMTFGFNTPGKILANATTYNVPQILRPVETCISGLRGAGATNLINEGGEYGAGTTMREQLNSGLVPGVYQVVMERAPDIGSVPISFWEVQRLDGIRSVVCANASSRGRFFYRPQNISGALNTTLASSDAKRRALTGSNTATIETFETFGYGSTAAYQDDVGICSPTEVTFMFDIGNQLPAAKVLWDATLTWECSDSETTSNVPTLSTQHVIVDGVDITDVATNHGRIQSFGYNYSGGRYYHVGSVSMPDAWYSELGNTAFIKFKLD